MIEVLFGESEAASMKVAKHTVIIEKTGGPTSVWVVGKKKVPKRPFEGWVPGTAEEVICLGFMLDMGDIKEEATSQYRKDLICSFYSQEQWGKDPEMDDQLHEAVEFYANELNRLKRYLEHGEAIRVWYSDASYSRCGFYHLCSVVKEFAPNIRIVKLPEYRLLENAILSYSSWNDVAAEEFAGFLPYEKALSQKEVEMYASLWEHLREENRPLRAVVNGKVISVSEDFYDFLIWEKLTKEPIKEARLIGNILGYYPLGIGDWWYAKRINHYIEQGKIKVVEDSDKLYARVICLAR